MHNNGRRFGFLSIKCKICNFIEWIALHACIASRCCTIISFSEGKFNLCRHTDGVRDGELIVIICTTLMFRSKSPTWVIASWCRLRLPLRVKAIKSFRFFHPHVHQRAFSAFYLSLNKVCKTRGEEKECEREYDISPHLFLIYCAHSAGIEINSGVDVRNQWGSEWGMAAIAGAVASSGWNYEIKK